ERCQLHIPADETRETTGGDGEAAPHPGPMRACAELCPAMLRDDSNASAWRLAARRVDGHGNECSAVTANRLTANRLGRAARSMQCIAGQGPWMGATRRSKSSKTKMRKGGLEPKTPVEMIEEFRGQCVALCHCVS